jgi:hypothetical protein
VNLNKRSAYLNFKEYSDILDETVLYICAKDEKEIKVKENILKKFCKEKNIKPKSIYKDITDSEELRFKPNLQKLIRDEENLDIITLSTSDIYKYLGEDYFDIKRYLRESNLGIYDLNYENYSLERKPLLYWLGNM